MKRIDVWRRARQTMHSHYRWALLGVLLSPLALAQVEVRNPTITGGGGVSTAPPYRLIGTFGDAGQGSLSEADVRLTSGFPATISDPPMAVFSDGFEN
jgi:hypothetical protein